jgi:hypothetical protein
LHDNKKLVALEVNMRPPGGFTTDMFNYACDFNIYNEWANVVINNKISGCIARKYHVCYAGRKFNKNYVMSKDEVLAKYASLIIFHDYIPGALTPALGNYGFILRGKELEPVLEAQKDIQLMY